MTKAEIAELATSLGYTVSESDTKAEMITAFLQQQGGSSTEPGSDDPGTTDPDPAGE